MLLLAIIKNSRFGFLNSQKIKGDSAIGKELQVGFELDKNHLTNRNDTSKMRFSQNGKTICHLAIARNDFSRKRDIFLI